MLRPRKGEPMVAPYTGNGAYCFTNALHTGLLAAGADPLALPEPWFLECLTAMPFGRCFAPGSSTFGISATGWSLDGQALTLAIQALGWRSELSHGGSAEEAVG